MELAGRTDITLGKCGDILVGNRGDYLVKHKDGSWGIIEKKVFHLRFIALDYCEEV